MVATRVQESALFINLERSRFEYIRTCFENEPYRLVQEVISTGHSVAA